jgi:transcriptional regulator with XRE-family HTH domain
MRAPETQPSPFGQRLRTWRRQRGLSQLDLAALAETTPRHVSFIETGRSRPGRELVLRLAQCMNLPVRERNRLLASAGLPPAYPQRDLDEHEMRPFRIAVEAILEHHEPYPGCAIDGLGQVQRTNTAFRALWPGAEDASPEQAIDAFFGPGPMRDMIENWAEVAWAHVDSRRLEAERTGDPRLLALVERSLHHLRGIARPSISGGVSSPVVCPRFRIGDRVIRTFTTVMRFEHAHEVTLNELRVELIFPIDEVGAAFFRGLADRRRSAEV